MRRCLIAIFALHFFLSVSAFALGDWAYEVAPGGSPVALSQAVQAPEAPASGATDASASHALVDELPDLPDSLPRSRAVQKPPVDGGPFIGYRQRAAPPPSLDGLLRPPQPAAFAA
jgi:hypothetical protein